MATKLLSPAAQSSEIEGHASVAELALDVAGQGVWDHDLLLRTVNHSPAWFKMRGFEAGEDVDAELGQWSDRVHPDDRARIEEVSLRQTRHETTDNNFEYRERHRNGQWIWIMSRGRPVAWKPDGSVARIVGTDTDITRLKQTEQQLAEEKERLHVTLQSIGDGMISTDGGGMVTFVNAAAEQLTGWDFLSVVGKDADTIFKFGPTRADGDGVVFSCMKRRETIQLDEEAILLTRTGATLDVRLTASPVVGPGGTSFGAVLVFQDATERRAMNRRLTHSATHDPLTGLPNRSAVHEAVQAAALSARRDLGEHALCYIDLDYFKKINDGAGHASGDRVLIKIARLLRRSCRTQDFIGRIGGDEFILLLRDCSLSVAEARCRRIVASIARQTFKFENIVYNIGASIGIKSITVHQPQPDELITKADTACYLAKSQGRGRVAIFHEDGNISAYTFGS